MSSDRIVKNTMVLYLRTFVTLIVSLFTSRITLDVLGIEGWGLYNVVGGFVALFAVMNSSLGLAAQRFLTMAIAKEENVGNVLAHSIRIHVVLAVVVMVVAEIIGTYYIYNQLNVPVNKRTLAFWVFQMSLISLAFSTLSVPFNSLLSSYERLDIFAYIEIGNVFLRLGIVYLLYLFSDRLLLYAICGAIISFLIYVIYRICCWRMFFSMHRLRFEINKKLLKEMLSFSGWTIMSSMAWLCRDQGLAVLLNAFMGLTVNAAYGMARQINMAVTKLTQNIVLVFVPIITKSYAVNDLKKTEKTLIASSKFGSILVMLAFVPIFFNIDFILSVWLKEVPSGTAMITVYILFMAVIICLFGNNAIVIRASGKIAFFEISANVCNVIFMVVAYYILKGGGTVEVVLMTLSIVTVIQVLIQLIIVSRLLSMSIFYFIREVIIKLVMALTFPCLICFVLAYYCTGWNKFILILFLNSTFFLISCYWIYFNKQERETVFVIAKKIRNKFIKKQLR